MCSHPSSEYDGSIVLHAHEEPAVSSHFGVLLRYSPQHLRSNSFALPARNRHCLSRGTLGEPTLGAEPGWSSLCRMVCFACLGLTYPAIHEASYAPQHLRMLIRSGKLDLKEPCRIKGICTRGSVPKGIGEQIELSVQQVENRFSTYATTGKVRLALYYQRNDKPRQPLLSAGDQIEVLANLRLPKNFNNPGQFDYVSYLDRQDVSLVGTVKSELLITRLATGQGSWLSRQIQHLRKALLSRLDRTFASERHRAS